MLHIRLALVAAIAIFGIWHSIESDIKTQCAGNQACLDASR